MKLFRRSVLVVLALVAAACERRKAPATTDSTSHAPTPAADSASAMAAATSWDQSAGPVLLVSTDAPMRAFVFVPDSANRASTLVNIPRPASVTLFGRNGTVQTAELPAIPDTSACATATLSAAPPPRPWSVGFIGGVVSPIAMDSIGSLPHADSAALTAGLNRLASALPNDSAGRFSGLQFVVRSIWRFSVPNGAQFIAGTLARSINQEATPLQERTLMVAERSPSDSGLTTVYSERSYGDEETIETREIIAAVLLGSSRNVAIVFSRDFGDAVAYALIERGDDGKWRVRWTSPRRHC
jgi:hypothetical protein